MTFIAALIILKPIILLGIQLYQVPPPTDRSEVLRVCATPADFLPTMTRTG